MNRRSSHWPHIETVLENVDDAPPTIGIIGLATDRVGIPDFEAFLGPQDDRPPVFSTRVPMAETATPETLAAMRAHLAAATALLVPGSRLDVVAFSCTSGTIAIGIENVRAAIRSVRPHAEVSTPITAGAAALRALRAKRIALLTPYLPATSDLVADYFEAEGFDIATRATFGLGGDPQMNRVLPHDLLAASQTLASQARDCDALFISCTGMRTAPVVALIEERIGKPVVTSNQALAWDCARLVGHAPPSQGRGALFQARPNT